MKPAVVVARCAAFGSKRRGPCLVRFVVDVDAYGQTPAFFMTYAGEPEAPRLAPVADAVPTLARCRAHRSYFRGDVLRVTGGSEPCGRACWQAEGTECKCSCLGANHGIA